MVAFICIWWFTAKSYREDFIVPAPYVVMVGITSGGLTYYADIDVPMSPKWIYGLGKNLAKDIAGSYGKLYILDSPTLYVHPYDGPTTTSTTSGGITNVAVDDAGIVGGLTSSGQVVHGGTTNSTTLMSSVSFSGGAAYAVGKDSNLYYSGTPKSGAWTNTTPSGTAGTWQQVSFDGAVCAIQKTGQLWSTDMNIGNAGANWTKQGSKLFSQICLKGGRLIGVGFGSDTATYYSNAYSSPSWTQLSLKTYDTAGKPQTTTPTFTKVIMFYPGLDARRKRFLGSAEACNPDEEEIGGFCYGACASGRAAKGTSCPYRKLSLPAIPSCDSGSEFINGSCYKPCPAGYRASGEKCLGITTDRGGSNAKPLNTDITPATYGCPPDGTIKARYVRIRPTTLVTNNKLCISKLVVKGANGQIFSLPSGMPNVVSKIGTMTGSAVYNNTKSIPVIGIKTLGGGSGSGSSSPLKIYVAQNSAGGTVMIAGGVAKTAPGSPYSWTDSYWLTGTTAAAGAYFLNLNKTPVKVYATDGTCIDAPIGGSSCAGFSSYISGTTYNGDADGGQANRSGKLYWDVDLGTGQEIKTIEFTGCDYIAPTATSASPPTTTVSQPNQDQITGMRVELLFSANEPGTTPLVSRTLGPKTEQVLTFNYVGREPLMENRCYDDCPPVNGVPTGYGGGGTCVSASGGITSRSVTSPLPLPDPVFVIPKNEDGTPYKLPSNAAGSSNTQSNISNWQLDPSNPAYSLSCDVLPGSILTPLVKNFKYPSATGAGTSITVPLLKSDGTAYINPATPFACVKYDDSACSSYGEFKYDGTSMCISSRFYTQTDYGRPDGASSTGGCAVYSVNPDGTVASSSCSCPRRNYTAYTTSHGYFTHSGLTINGGNPNPNPLQPGVLGKMINYTACTGGDANCPYCVWDIKIPIIEYEPYNTANYNIPKVPEQNIANPKRIDSVSRCLNGDGTINKEAHIYNKKCVKCSSPTDIFFAKGAAASSYNWSTEKPNTWMSLYATDVNGTRTPVDPGYYQYKNIQDAKQACETNLLCGGVTKTYDSDGTPFYSLRAGTPMSTADEASGPNGTGIDRTNVTPRDSTWVKLGAGSQKTVPDDEIHKGMAYSTADIPRSFADDYVGSFAKAAPPRSFDIMSGSSTSFDIIQMLSSAVLQAQSAWTSFQNSVQNNTYYQLVGLERIMFKDQVSTDFGICVGPCDTPHSYHEPIQLLYSSNSVGTTTAAYILYGTTCHDPTLKKFEKPSIPGNYTPQKGSLCDDNYEASGGKCIAQCDSNSKQTGTSCTTQPTARAFSAPSYVCPPNLTKLDTVCVSPCGPGFTDDGEFCQPIVATAAMPAEINCTKTDYGFAAGSGTGKVNKWLCDSSDDLTALVSGPTTYTQKDDIVCYADDPSTGMYYCSSIDDFKNSVQDSGREDLTISCDTLLKSYLDLSNNLTVLMDAQTSATTAAGQINAIEKTLQKVITDVCATSGSSGTACTNLNTYLLALQSNIASGGAGSSILSPINVGIQSRDSIVKLLKEYQCCSLEPGQTEYPWC